MMVGERRRDGRLTLGEDAVELKRRQRREIARLEIISYDDVDHLEGWYDTGDVDADSDNSMRASGGGGGLRSLSGPHVSSAITSRSRSLLSRPPLASRLPGNGDRTVCVYESRPAISSRRFCLFGNGYRRRPRIMVDVLMMTGA